MEEAGILTVADRLGLPPATANLAVQLADRAGGPEGEVLGSHSPAQVSGPAGCVRSLRGHGKRSTVAPLQDPYSRCMWRASLLFIAHRETCATSPAEGAGTPKSVRVDTIADAFGIG